MTEKIIYYDISSVILLLVLLVSFIYRKMTKGRLNLIFISIVSVVLLTSLSNALGEYYGNFIFGKPISSNFRYFLFSVYFISRDLVLPLYILYIYEITGTFHLFLRSMIQKFFVFIFAIIVFVAIILNFFNHNIFFINQEGVYERGPHLFYVYMFAVFYIIYGIILLIKNRKNIEKRKLAILFCYFPMNLLGVLIQFFHPEYQVEGFFTTLSIMIASINLQVPEETIDSSLKILNYNSFISEMKKNFIVNKNLRMIFIKVVNHRKIKSLIGWEKYIKLNKEISDYLDTLCHGNKTNVFFIEHFTFVMVVEAKSNDFFRNTKTKIHEYFLKKKSMLEKDFDMELCLCTVECPSDISDIGVLLNFASNLPIRISTRNKFVSYKSLASSNRFKISNEIDEIINRGISSKGFKMMYQPIYSVKEKRFVSAEALIRLYDEKYGYISPEIFIPAAEKSGAIIHIGDFVLENVIRYISECDFDELSLDYIEFNLSVAQCIEPSIVKKIVDMLARYNVDAEKINLEITETASDFDPDTCRRNIHTLSRLGYALSLDDYGTGYSNIYRVITIPFSIVKLDKNYVINRNDEKMKIVTKHTIKMLKNLGKKILIEGVETKEDEEYFSSLGCDYVQGFYYSRPLDEADFIEFIKEKNGK